MLEKIQVYQMHSSTHLRVVIQNFIQHQVDLVVELLHLVVEQVNVENSLLVQCRWVVQVVVEILILLVILRILEPHLHHLMEDLQQFKVILEVFHKTTAVAAVVVPVKQETLMVRDKVETDYKFLSQILLEYLLQLIHTVPMVDTLLVEEVETIPPELAPLVILVV